MYLQSKLFLGFCFIFFLSLLIFFSPTVCNAQTDGPLIPSPYPVGPKDSLVLDEKITFEWSVPPIPPESGYTLAYYELQITSNINDEGVDYTHGFILKVFVNGKYNKFPPNGDGYDVSKLKGNINGNFAWRVRAVVGCGSTKKDGEWSQNSVNKLGAKIPLSLYEFRPGVFDSSKSCSNVYTKFPIIKESKTYATLVDGYPMIDFDFVRKYLGATFRYEKEDNSAYVVLRRYEQEIKLPFELLSDKINTSQKNCKSDVQCIWKDEKVKGFEIPIKYLKNIPYPFNYTINTEVKLYIPVFALKWLGVNYLDIGSYPYKFVKISDQGTMGQGNVYDISKKACCKEPYVCIPSRIKNDYEGSNWEWSFYNTPFNDVKYSIDLNSTKYGLACHCYPDPNHPDCICNNNTCYLCGNDLILNKKLLVALQKTIEEWEKYVEINQKLPDYKKLKADCAYRCCYHNNFCLGGEKNSGHMFGCKVDLDLREPMEKEEKKEAVNLFCGFIKSNKDLLGWDFFDSEYCKNYGWADLLIYHEKYKSEIK